MGVSFRLKTLKKFIWPILIGILAYFLGSGVIANAQDYLSQDSYNVNDLSYCDIPLSEYIDYFTKYKGDLYEFYVSYYGGNSIFTFYPTLNNTHVTYSVEGVTDTSMVNWLYLGSSNSSLYSLMSKSSFSLSLSNTKCNNLDFRDNVQALSDFTSWTESYHNFYDNYNTIFNNVNSTNFTGYSNRTGSPTSSRVNTNNFDNKYNAYVELDYSSQNQYLIYSSIPVYYDSSPTYRNFTTIKPLMLNGVLYNTGDLITFDYIPDEGFIDSYNNLPDIYLYFDKSYISNLGYKLQFRSTSFMVNNNVRYMLSRAYGRKTINNTYYYEPIDCKINLSQAGYSESNGTVTFGLNGLTCSTDLSSYDYISASITFYRDDDSILDSFSYIKSSFTNGIDYKKFGGSGYYGDIFQPLRGLSGDFVGFISSSNNYNNILTIKSDNRWVYSQPYNLTSLSVVNPIYNEFLGSTIPYDTVYQNYGLGIDQGVLFSLDDQHRVNSVNLDLFFDSNSYLYINDPNNGQI